MRPRLGGNRGSEWIEADASLIPDLAERAPGITLKEIRAELAKAGVPVGIGALFHKRRARRCRQTPVVPITDGGE